MAHHNGDGLKAEGSRNDRRPRPGACNVGGAQRHERFGHDVHRLAALAVDGRRNDVGQSGAVAFVLRDAALVERVVEAVGEVDKLYDPQPRTAATRVIGNVGGTVRADAAWFSRAGGG